MQNVDNFIEEEKRRAIEISNEVIEKPKISMMIVIFPFLLINYIQELRVYRYKKEFFIKEYLFLKKIVVHLLKEGYFSSEKIKDEIEKLLIKDEKYLEFYRCQIQEAISIKKYILQEESEKVMRLKEIETLKKWMDIFEVDEESLGVSLKLLRTLNNKI
ncbi:hypothetical protein [uncultured Cetobacterium sp.]|uniref:hypothetical protein n=1 Tax=uncultured Cetobacterium sp. TaxID=527638 RepID=UPI002631635F|nr:hypothetical protein [uncultured Cetobacterium sp.]